MSEYEYLKGVVDPTAMTERAMSPQGRAFMARAELRQELREFSRRSDLDIMKAVLQVKP